MIPKIIHLCWFSGDPYPQDIQKCLDTWHNILPDYNVKVWNKEMALATGIPFVREAIKAGRWAFASDVIRVYALYHEGGIYMDSDIFLFHRFDEYLTSKVVLFIEYFEEDYQKKNQHTLIQETGERRRNAVIHGCNIQAAFMAAEPGHPLMKSFLEIYEHRHFLWFRPLWQFMLSPNLYSKKAYKFGYRYRDVEQHFDDDVSVYPSKCLTPYINMDTSQSFAIHLCAHSWWSHSLWHRLVMIKRRIFKKRLGEYFKFRKNRSQNA